MISDFFESYPLSDLQPNIFIFGCVGLAYGTWVRFQRISKQNRINIFISFSIIKCNARESTTLTLISWRIVNWTDNSFKAKMMNTKKPFSLKNWQKTLNIL